MGAALLSTGTSATPETPDTSELALGPVAPNASRETSAESSCSSFGSCSGSTSMVVASFAAAGAGILALLRCPLGAGRFLGAPESARPLGHWMPFA